MLSMDSVNPLIQELVTISEHSTATANAVLECIHTPDPPPLLILDLYHLRIAGFRRLQDLMSNTGRGVLNIKQVELKTGKTLTGRAATAFRRVSYMLTLPPGATKDTYKSRPPARKATTASTQNMPGCCVGSTISRTWTSVKPPCPCFGQLKSRQLAQKQQWMKYKNTLRS